MAYLSKRDQAAAAQRHYRQNAPTVKDRAKAFTKKARIRNREVVVQAKARPCADCGVSYPSWVMQFDHIADDKEGAVANLSGAGVGLDRLRAEIAKCEVVCANCHAERTHARFVALGHSVPKAKESNQMSLWA